jgi:hypothetical protein
MGGDIREGLAGLVNKGSSALGYEIPKHVASDVLRGVGGVVTGGILAGPTSETTTKAAESVFGKEYDPQTIPGNIVKKAVEFAPGIVGGPGNLATRALTQVGAPAVASTAAEQGGAGPLGQAAAAVGSSILAHRMVTPRATAVPIPRVSKSARNV